MHDAKWGLLVDVDRGRSRVEHRFVFKATHRLGHAWLRSVRTSTNRGEGTARDSKYKCQQPFCTNLLVFEWANLKGRGTGHRKTIRKGRCIPCPHSQHAALDNYRKTCMTLNGDYSSMSIEVEVASSIDLFLRQRIGSVMHG